MKIACITPSRIPSSTANSIQAVKVSHAMAALGHTVRVFFPGEEPVDWDDLVDQYELSNRFDFIHLPSNPKMKRYDFIWKSLSEARRWKADVIYTWLPQAAWLAGVYKIPTVLELHDRLSGAAGPLFFRWFLGSRGKRRLMVITHALQKRLEKQLKEQINPDLIRVAPNGVDLIHYLDLPDARIARSLLNLPQKFTAVYTGHFYAGRGMNLLLHLAEELPSVSYVWVGGRPEDVVEWQERVDKAGMENVTITGFIPKMQLPLFQAAGDVLLMPYEQAIAGSSGGNSAEICSPMKMFDYLATGRVIITSELPVLHEVLNIGNAVFCPPVNVDSWATAIEELQADPRRAAYLARQAKQDSEQYSWENRARLALEGMDRASHETK
jgi:glycosyltransferase involved in cell wall biosynthesis